MDEELAKFYVEERENRKESEAGETNVVSLLCNENECSAGPATTAGDAALPSQWPVETIKLALTPS